MPLTSEQRAAYGPEWAELSRSIREERAQGRCECTGECKWKPHVLAALDSAMLGDIWEPESTSPRCRAQNGQRSPYTGSKVVLTVAHLDRNGHEGVHRPERLKAMCQGCHLSYDRQRPPR